VARRYLRPRRWRRARGSRQRSAACTRRSCAAAAPCRSGFRFDCPTSP
jgi:hypothetical protein